MQVMHPHPEKHYILNRDMAAKHFNDTWTTNVAFQWYMHSILQEHQF
jgi:hypothetical protein